MAEVDKSTEFPVNFPSPKPVRSISQTSASSGKSVNDFAKKPRVTLSMENPVADGSSSDSDHYENSFSEFHRYFEHDVVGGEDVLKVRPVALKKGKGLATGK
jgi:hypothetical protein